MSKWEKVRLGDVLDIKSGGTPSTKCLDYYINGDVPWVKTGDLKQKYILHTNDMITQDAVKNSSAKIFPVGTVLLAMYGATIGACSILSIEAATNQACAAFLPCDKILSEYLYYCLLANKKTFINDGVGGAQPNISAGYLKQYEIPLPPLAEQQKIADTLDKVSHLIALRKEQLSKLDLLVKAKFVEMFGDPVENPMGWTQINLLDLCNTIVDCPHSTPKYTSIDTGFMCIRTSIIKKNKLLWNEIEYIEEAEFYDRTKRRQPQKGDIVYSREGAILGIAAMIDRDCNVALGQRMMLLSCNTNVCIPEFLTVAMNFSSFLNKALENVSGSASPHINVADIKSFRMIHPPLALQTQFADYVTQVETSKKQIQQGLEKLEVLYRGLMQEYFE